MADLLRAGHRVAREPPVPPVPPEGWTPGPPDFIGVGAAEAGGSWWFNLIAAYPGIRVPSDAPGDRGFFAEHLQEPASSGLADAYWRWFPRPTGDITGEWNAEYMFHFWIPPLLGEVAPQAKVIVMLRDPLERYLSGVSKMSAVGYDLAANVSAGVGLYHRQLSGVLKVFDRTQLLILQYETCLSSPQQEFDRTIRFLGLDPRSQGQVPTAQPDASVPSGQTGLTPDLAEGLLNYYTDDLVRLFRDFGDAIDAARWPSCGRIGLG